MLKNMLWARLKRGKNVRRHLWISLQQLWRSNPKTSRAYMPTGILPASGIPGPRRGPEPSSWMFGLVRLMASELIMFWQLPALSGPWRSSGTHC